MNESHPEDVCINQARWNVCMHVLSPRTPRDDTHETGTDLGDGGSRQEVSTNLTVFESANWIELTLRMFGGDGD